MLNQKMNNKYCVTLKITRHETLITNQRSVSNREETLIMSSKLSEYVRNGDGVIQVDSFADLSKMVIEKLSGNDKFKKHRKISSARCFLRFSFYYFHSIFFFKLLFFI